MDLESILLVVLAVGVFLLAIEDEVNPRKEAMARNQLPLGTTQDLEVGVNLPDEANH